ncbi:MAG: hypothetical protein Q9M92_04160 [Enterobacterales bacterium]|nr:hypothetical protein [Enterobacterales bacterium]
MTRFDAKVEAQQVNFYHRATLEISFHLFLITICLLFSVYFYWFDHPDQGSTASKGYLINAAKLQDPMYHPAEPIAFLTKSLSTRIHYNFLNEAIRLDDFGYAFSTESQQAIKGFLSALDLNPLQRQLQVSFEAEFAPILLDYEAPSDQPYQWAYDLDFLLLLNPLQNNQPSQQIGPFHLRSIISRTQQPVNGYLLQISSIVFSQDI